MNQHPDMSLPKSDHLFVPTDGPDTIIQQFGEDEDAVRKLSGKGDSGGKRSSRKAPGGRDSAKKKDGG